MPRAGANYGIDDVVELVSQRVAVRLVETFPGTVLYIPKKITADHELCAIGEAEAKTLSRELGGSHIGVPMSIISNEKRRLLIYKLASENISRREIALRAGCTERRVYQILGENRRQDDRQASLF